MSDFRASTLMNNKCKSNLISCFPAGDEHSTSKARKALSGRGHAAAQGIICAAAAFLQPQLFQIPCA